MFIAGLKNLSDAQAMADNLDDTAVLSNRSQNALKTIGVLIAKLDTAIEQFAEG